MSELVDRAIEVARDSVSGALCNAAGVSRVASDLAGKINPRYDSTPGGRVSRAAQRALERFCPVPPSPPLDDYLPTDPGFDGGQCPGVLYEVERLSPGGDFRGQGLGPVSTEVRANVAAPTNPAGRSVFVCFGTGATKQCFEASRGTEESVAASSFTVSRVDGLPDECGEPGPVAPYPEPPPPSSPEPPGTIININLPGIGPVDIDFSPTIGIIYVGPNFDIRVPVSVKISGPNIDFNIDIDFNLSDPTEPPDLPPESPPVDPDGRPEPPDCPPPIECDEHPTEEEPADELPETDEDENPQQVLAGVFFVTEINAQSKATEIFQDENPNIYAPALGYCAFAYELPDGGLIWSQDFPVKNTRAIIPAPDVGLRCVLARGTPNPGVTWLARTIGGRKGCK